MNKVFLVGRVSKDLEVKNTIKGTSYINTTLAIRESEEKTSFITIRIWDKAATTFAAYIEKGDLITIEGKIVVDRYQKDNKTKYFTYVNVSRLYFGFKPKGGQSGN